MKNRLLFLSTLVLMGCNRNSFAQTETTLVVLGTIQDAGSPHIACKKECCANLFENPDSLRKVVSIGIIDSENKKTFLFEATIRTYAVVSGCEPLTYVLCSRPY